ncbi:MAG: hypothetical protein LBG13_03390 [Holosporales bacterium]|jgi:hypothetical protein|nr:hypothetical protein [Holosporales bacterium]
MNIGFKLGCYVAAMVLGGVIGNASAMVAATSDTVAIPEYTEGEDVMWSWGEDGKPGYQRWETRELLNGQAKLKLYKGGDSALEGKFVNGLLEGEGKLTYGDGSVYEGTFKSCEPTENGKLTCKNGVIYKGGFKDRSPSGQGRLIYSDGSTYEGEFRHGVPRGKGKFTHPDGEVEEGYLIEGKFYKG